MTHTLPQPVVTYSKVGFKKVTKVYKSVSHCESSISGPQCQGKEAVVRELHAGPDFGTVPDYFNERRLFSPEVG